MQSTPPSKVECSLAVVEHELARLSKDWLWFFLLGVLLIVCGTVAIGYPVFSSAALVLVLGAILLIGGIATIIGAFWAGRWSAFLLQLLVGILYVMAGLAIRDSPLEAKGFLTLFIAAFFILVGTFRVVVSLVERFPQWGWALLNGVVTLIAGIIIYDAFPSSALWVIGLLVGIELILNGWTWVMLAMSIRQLNQPTQEVTKEA